jgi:RND family efflux transporter MFP subunit
MNTPSPILSMKALISKPPGGLLFTLLSIGAVALSGCSRDQAQQNPNAAVLVRVVEVEPAHSTEKAHYTGVVRARTESSLGFRVAGKITERLVNAGDTVRKGQPLMRLDPVDFDLALRAAQAAVEAARAVLTQADLEKARARTLVAKGAVSQDVLERATAAADSSAAQVRSAEAQAAQIANQTGYATLLADSDGIVMTTTAEPGQVVSAGQTVLVLAHDGRREALIDVPERDLRGIADRSATAQLYPDQTSSVGATLREVSGVADPTTRTFQARYVLDGDPKAFPLGATVTIGLSPSRHSSQSVVEVPLGSLIDRGDGASVWVVDRGTSVIQKRVVSIEQLGQETVRISEGLLAGDLVVSLGAQLLNDGQIVRVTGASVQGTK